MAYLSLTIILIKYNSQLKFSSEFNLWGEPQVDDSVGPTPTATVALYAAARNMGRIPTTICLSKSSSNCNLSRVTSSQFYTKRKDLMGSVELALLIERKTLVVD